MKFVYVDETGDKGQTDVLVMTGLLIDAYLLRKHTASFDRMLTTFLAKRAFSVTGPRRKLPANDSPPCSLTSLVPTLKQLEACWSWTS